MSLEPRDVEIEADNALTLNGNNIAVRGRVTVAIGKEPSVMQNAAQRLLGLKDREVASQARDIILGQLRFAIEQRPTPSTATLPHETIEILQRHGNAELNKLGLEIVSLDLDVVEPKA